MKTFTLIGGPAHGQVVTVEDDRKSLSVQVDVGDGFMVTSYRCQKVTLPGTGVFTVFVHSDVRTLEQMFAAFLSAAGVPQ